MSSARASASLWPTDSWDKKFKSRVVTREAEERVERKRRAWLPAALVYSSSSPKSLPVVGFTRWTRWHAKQVTAS
jgi:hypothetical protein